MSIAAGSLSSYTNRNPSFSVYELDAEFLIPLSFKTYYLNLTKANIENRAQWELLHDFTSEYDLTDLSPDTLYNAFAKEIYANE